MKGPGTGTRLLAWPFRELALGADGRAHHDEGVVLIAEEAVVDVAGQSAAGSAQCVEQALGVGGDLGAELRDALQGVEVDVALLSPLKRLRLRRLRQLTWPAASLTAASTSAVLTSSCLATCFSAFNVALSSACSRVLAPTTNKAA
jgi:hypothetical protein